MAIRPKTFLNSKTARSLEQLAESVGLHRFAGRESERDDINLDVALADARIMKIDDIEELFRQLRSELEGFLAEYARSALKNKRVSGVQAGTRFLGQLLLVFARPEVFTLDYLVSNFGWEEDAAERVLQAAKNNRAPAAEI